VRRCREGGRGARSTFTCKWDGRKSPNSRAVALRRPVRMLDRETFCGSVEERRVAALRNVVELGVVQ
jgi:hypothetical protein